MESIPLVDLQAQQAEIFEDIRGDIEDVLRSAAFIGGPAVGRFEREYADFTGTGHCIGTGNGTDALELALRACGVCVGDEVIVPANTFVATAEAVARIGAVPVLVDVDPEQLLIDPGCVARPWVRGPGPLCRCTFSVSWPPWRRSSASRLLRRGCY